MSKLSLNEILNGLTGLIKNKEASVNDLYQKAYAFFRQIIIYPSRDLDIDVKKLKHLSDSIHEFMTRMNAEIPGLLKSLNENKEISKESKGEYRGNLLNTKGLNELICLLESIAIELTRDESYDNNRDSQQQLKDLVENSKTLSRETKEFVVLLESWMHTRPTLTLYTIEKHSIGIALIMVYSFVVSINLSFIRLKQESYENYLNLSADYEFYTDLFLPLFGIPGYILLHYISTRLTLKVSFMCSIFALVVGNALYYVAYDANNVWFYLVGKAIIVSRLPMYGVKQFIGFYSPPKERVKLSTCSVAAVFLGLSCGYFLSLSSTDYEGGFLAFNTNGYNIGALLSFAFWLVIASFCSVLFASPDNLPREKGHEYISIQVLTIISYILPFILLQAFASNHSLPSEILWDKEKFYTFLGVFCLMAVPMHILVYISSYFTTDISLIVASKVLCIIAAGLQMMMYVAENSKEFWYVVGGMLIVMGINIGIGVNFAMLAGNVDNHRIGLFSGMLEILGLVIGNVAVNWSSAIKYTQPAIIGLVVFTLALDIVKYKDFNPLRKKVGDAGEVDEKKNN